MITTKEPNIVLCSTQYRGSIKSTFNYFGEKGYFLFVHLLIPEYSDLNTPCFDNLGLTNWLLAQESIIGIRSGRSKADSRVK